jgi:glucokinase
MDVGGTRTKYGLVKSSPERSLVAQRVEKTQTTGLDEFIAAADHAVFQLCQDAGISRSAIAAAGLGVPGYVDGDLISMVYDSIAFMEGSSLRPALQDALGIPVYLDNDARLIALGEAYFGGHASAGRANPFPPRLLSLTLGTGLGVALVVNGRLQEKSSINHLAGHIPIRPVTRPCFCGFSGCLESLVSSAALVTAYLEFSGQTARKPEEFPESAQTVYRLAEEGNPAAEQAIRQWLVDLTSGLNAYIYLYGPDVIVLGGGMAKSLPPWVSHLRQGLFAHPFRDYRVTLDLTTLGEQAGLYGAAALTMSR